MGSILIVGKIIPFSRAFTLIVAKKEGIQPLYGGGYALLEEDV